MKYFVWMKKWKIIYYFFCKVDFKKGAGRSVRLFQHHRTLKLNVSAFILGLMYQKPFMMYWSERYGLGSDWLGSRSVEKVV